jgi:aspartyl aminopeptidase
MMPKKTNNKMENLRKQLLRKPKFVWDVLNAGEKKKALAFCQSYKKFLDDAKTEREAVQAICAFAQEKGFVDISGRDHLGKLYRINKFKNIALAVLGKKPLIQGIRLIASHLDAPRLDVKQNPLYEELDLVFLKTHYYGGIKKYQWLARPLAIHGTVFDARGRTVVIRIGEEEEDPVFTIADLLPHLSRKMESQKKVSEAFEAEKLNILVGSLPLGEEKISERFKLAVLDQLHRRHKLIEEDLMSAELEIVPAGKAKDVGWDRGLVGAYGQDDRACAFASLEAIGEMTTPEYTTVAVFLDKEEVGSEGSTAARSRFLETLLAELFEKTGQEPTSKSIRTCLMHTKALSADVTGALDPDYQEVHEKRNAAKIGYGVCLTKFTGSGGKYGASDANAEFLSEIRLLLNKNNVVWQTGELGKVDEGGGGTIAKFLAVHGMEVLDCGTPLLSVHSPFEIASKADLYMTYKAYATFLAGK